MKRTLTITYIVCEKCGKRIPDLYFSRSSKVHRKMLKECLCWECAFWSGIVRKKRKYDVIGGKCYLLLPEQGRMKRPAMLGMDGKKFCIMRKDFTTVSTNDAWLIGTVPENFREELPDTAWIITPRAYRILRKRGGICKNRYCMDRYHCLFYKWWDEDEAEIISRIPKDWRTGDEMCPSFLNFGTEIRDFWDYLKEVDFGKDRKLKQRIINNSKPKRK